VQIDAGKPDEALKTLAEDPGAAFATDYHEARGDAYAAKKDVAQAVSEYRAALGPDPNAGPQSSIIALKLADLGVSPVPAPAASAALATPAAPPPAALATPASANKGKP
jgi:hypothetical protein